MFAKILIANRGEIACRIIRTARAMGIATVAVYSDPDAKALHVRLADEAVPIGPAAAYLDIEKIVSACAASGAGAVHPGYGFLSENAAFARALRRAGVVFIGPNERAIEAMGDKIAAKAFARAAGVSIVPGFAGVVEDMAEAARIAAEIGYPVMIKASAGGGGRGLRVAASAPELIEAVSRAKSEAGSSFGHDRIFIEKFIRDPRHIEIQVLGDRHGAVIHLGERECSIQRRHQKVIEEAPSPFLDAAMREAMGEQAAALARAVDYDSAGTVEFIVDQDRNFYFLEMNTRLQVEHPVTELVTGVDLVEQMIRIAAGEPLSIRESDVNLSGAAIETRIYAEDPARGFLPAPGRLVTYRPPPDGREGGVTVRIDTGVAEGADIPIDYDPLIAKLVTHAGDRAGAVEAQAQALDRFAIEGVQTNILFLAAVMDLPRWRRGELSTGFIAEEFPAGFTPREPAGEPALRLAAVAAAIDHRIDARKRLISGQMRAPPPDSARTRIVFLGRARHDVQIQTVQSVSGEGGLIVRFEAPGETRLCASDWGAGRPVWEGSINGESVAVQVRPILNGYALTHRGVATEAHVYSPREAEFAALMPERTQASGPRALMCPMPALIKAIHVAAGEQVEAGQALCVIEAMKMETVLHAGCDATVAMVCAGEGDRLAIDDVILRFV
jgi:propionyl-CoA carboxylase alpha chain